MKKSPVALCLLLLLYAGAARAEPVATWALVDESDAFVRGSLTDVVSSSTLPRALSWLAGASPWLRPLFTVHGHGTLIVEESFVGPFQPGDRVWLTWARPIEAEEIACPPPLYLESLAGRKSLWLLRVGTGGSPAVYEVWSAEDVDSLAYAKSVLDVEDASERVRLVRDVVAQHLDRALRRD